MRHALENQIRVIHVNQLGVILKHSTEATGGDHLEILASELSAELTNRALHTAQERVIQTGLHAGLGVGAQNRIRSRNFHFRQLGRISPQSGRTGTDAGGDDAGIDHALVAHVRERGGGAEISHQHWAAILVIGTGAVGQNIRTQRFRIVNAHVHTGLDARSHHHRINVEEFDDGRTEGVHHFRHHRTDDHIVHIGWLKTAHSQEFSQKQPILIRRMVGFGGDAVGAGDGIAIQKAQHDVRIADINGDQHDNPPDSRWISCAILQSHGYDGLRWSTQRGGQP